MTEIKANRVDSIDFDHDVDILKHIGGSARGREKRYRRTAEGQWSRRRSQIQSWKTSTRSQPSQYDSRHGSGHHTVDKNRARTLESDSPRRARRKSEGDVIDDVPLRAAERVNHEILHQGMLHKTSRAKTATTSRKQSEHRQYRRFQLTEHALEYTQLLQRVRLTIILLPIVWFSCGPCFLQLFALCILINNFLPVRWFIRR